QKEVMICLGRWTFPSQVSDQRFGDCWQQWKLDRYLRFWPMHCQYAGPPVQIFESKRKNFSGPKTIGSQQQQDGKVALARRFGLTNRPQHALHIRPWQSSWRAR